MEQHKDDVIAALVQVLKPTGILFKNDSAARDAEGLNRYVETVFGLVPEWVALEENGVKFEAPVMEGQKTGWFYDHRMNRARLAPYVKGKRVLDLFSYIGGWGVQAGDVFEALRELKAAEERFDVIVADPPAFIKRKKDLKNGEGAYRRLNEQAMRLLSKDGILVSASCSMHLPEDDLQNILLTSARHLDRNMQLLERGGQGPDHPFSPVDHQGLVARFRQLERARPNLLDQCAPRADPVHPRIVTPEALVTRIHERRRRVLVLGNHQHFVDPIVIQVHLPGSTPRTAALALDQAWVRTHAATCSPVRPPAVDRPAARGLAHPGSAPP
uniref:Methyltrans_SAM domain-containing protein n=1 Tax=Steinernema glaseri TaxID=37863 RepID=A0A1I8AJP6_9BILA